MSVNINDLLARAAALRDETALNSISPDRAGGIMYDTLLAMNELWLQQGSALVISKIYASVAAMEADSAPVSDLTGQPLRPGQIVVIASSDSDNGSVYRYDGTEDDTSSWSEVGAIGGVPVVDSLDSASSTLPLAARQGKALDAKIDEAKQDMAAQIIKAGLHQFLKAENVTANTYYPFPYFDGVSKFRISNIGATPIKLYLRKEKSTTDQIELSIPVGAHLDVNPSSGYLYIFYYITTGTSGGSFVINPLSTDQLALESEVGEIISEVEALHENLNIERYDPIMESDVISDSYINQAGNLTNPGNPAFKVAVYPVVSGTKLRIFNNLHAGVAYSYAFYSSDAFTSATAVKIGPAVVSTEEDVFIENVPNSAQYVLISTYLSSQNVSVITEVPIDDAVEAILEDVSLMRGKAQLAYQFANQNLFIAYNDGIGVEMLYWFRKCMANDLFTFYKVGYRNVTRTIPSIEDIETDSNIVWMNIASSDNIGPFLMSTGGWVGGNHTWLNEGVVKTARTDAVRIFIDKKMLEDDIRGYCEEVIICVDNTIYDPAVAPEEGEDILSTVLAAEHVTYAVRKNTIELSVTHHFSETTENSISTYYGMQSCFAGENYIITPNGQLVDWQVPSNQSFTKEAYPNFDRFVEKNTISPCYQAAYLYPNFGLGRHLAIADNDNIFRQSGYKAYHNVIHGMSTIAGRHLQWGGAYTFFKTALVDDSDLLVYRGILNGRDTLFVNTKRPFAGSIELPSDLILRKANIVECHGIVDGDNDTIFQYGGEGIYISSASAGSLILSFDQY